MRNGVLQLYFDVLAALPRGAKPFLITYAVALAALSILDGIAVALLAALTTPVLTGTPVHLPVLGEVNETGLLLLLGLVCFLIILKAVVATAMLWVATRRFATYDRAVGAMVFSAYMRAPWVERLKRNSAELVRTSDTSVGHTIASFLLPGATLPGEVTTFIAVLGVLAVAQPLTALVTFVYMLLLGILLFFWVTRAAKRAGRVANQHSIVNVRLITEMIAALKEITLRNKTPEVAGIVDANRAIAARARGHTQFLGQVPRYVLDAGIIGGVVLVGAVGGITGGLTGAVGAIAVFGLAGFRLAPSIVRFQSVIAQLNSTYVHAEAVLREIRDAQTNQERLDSAQTAPWPDEPRALRFEGVAFRYQPDLPDAVHDLDFEIPLGSSIAFVGASGSGKSTIVDLLLGLIEPTRGRIRLDDTDLRELTDAWRARVGYVPQEVALFDATIAQNVALSWSDDFDRERVTDALRQAQILDMVESRVGGLDSKVGERGLALSGGQRQRLGIARALYAAPLVLVMDEATSALDTATEAAVTRAIRELRGHVTTVTVAHRLATIREADRIFFMRDGQVVASGSFESLLREVPDFALQAALAGLADDDEDD